MAIPKDYDDFGQACFAGRLEAIQEYLNAGLSLDGHDDQRAHERPLSLALMNKQFAAAQLLLDAGAKPRYGAAFLDDFLDDARYEPFIERILDDACPEIADSLERTLVKAVESGNRPMAQRLLAVCPGPQEFSPRFCPLIAAIKSKQTEMALWLIDEGFGYKSDAEKRTPPVAYAILADEPVILQALLDRGESPERRVNGHQSALIGGPALYARLRHVRDFPKNSQFEIFHEGSLLHVAAVAGSAGCAKVLLEAGGDPGAVDSEGRTPAMLAVLGGEPTREVLKLLPAPDLSSGPALADLLRQSLLEEDVVGVRKAIELGADLSQAVKSSYSTRSTSLIVAACRGSVEVLQTLLEGGADIEQVDWPEGEKRNVAGLRLLIENAGLDSLLRMPVASARTAFGWASLHGRVEAMKFLLDAGAEVNARDVFQFTALHLAALGDQPKAVQFLIDLGLDLHAEAFDKLTPLHAAAQANALKAIPVLIEAGADATRKSKNGQTPYLVAKEYGNPGAYRKLAPHTPEKLQTKKRKEKKEPGWQWRRTAFEKILKSARSQHGQAAKKLTTQTFRKRLGKAVQEKNFLETAGRLRKLLKGAPAGAEDNASYICCAEGVEISDARLLRIQKDFLDRSAFVVRELRSKSGGFRAFAVPTTDLFEVLGAMGTNGVNMGLDSASLIAWLMSLYDRRRYRLIGVAHDGLEFRFNEPIPEPNGLVEELMTVCPPPMDEQQERKRLVKKLKSKTPQVMLWWD